MVKTMKITKWGTGLGIRLPSEFINSACLDDKMYVELHTKGDVLTVKPIQKTKSLDEIIAECADWDGSPPEKIDWGQPVGREIF